MSKVIDEIEASQACENEGRGISLVRDITMMLRKGLYRMALKTFITEHKSLLAHTSVLSRLHDHFGPDVPTYLRDELKHAMGKQA